MKGNSLSILLIEDNPGHVKLIKRSFENNRVVNEIFHVSDGEMALDYLFNRNEFSDPVKAPKPQIILLDLRLPKIDGLDVLKEIKASNELRSIPVVILTTSNLETDIGKAYQYHANSYLVKPVDFEKFTQLMETLGFYWLGWNCNPFDKEDS